MCRHLGLTASRPRPITVPLHNTEYTDNFSTDPSTRWTGYLGGTLTWDSGNSEIDGNMDNTDAALIYTANDPGSIEQESQLSFFLDGRATKDYAGVALRWDTAADDGYVFMASNQDDTMYWFRYLAGTRSTISSYAKTLAVDQWHTIRIAASGAVGSSVSLAGWDTLPGSKPGSDPGWYGVDGTPDGTATDSSVDRLDASTHLKCGFGWVGGGVDYDPQVCYFKERAISDRAGAGTNPKGPLGNPFFGPFGGPI